ncbi:hypothetical protein DL98DRAFT_56993 [Cadophora sp. DSE1049]|nr:hypothetical protein DL98DRAFT_56993 [Cadophora sp. DSE1049]
MFFDAILCVFGAWVSSVMAGGGRWLKYESFGAGENGFKVVRIIVGGSLSSRGASSRWSRGVGRSDRTGAQGDRGRC